MLSDSSLSYSESSFASEIGRNRKNTHHSRKSKNFEDYIATKLDFLNQKTRKITFDLEKSNDVGISGSITSPMFRQIVTPKTDIACQIKNL